MTKRHKYSAVPTTIDGIRFHSKAEATHYAELKLREKAGEIHDLVLQPEYLLTIWPYNIADGTTGPGTTVGKYIADFRYLDIASNRRVIVDVKGYDTPVSKLKRKIVEALYGIEIEIVK